MSELNVEERKLLTKLSKPIITFDKFDQMMNEMFPNMKNIVNGPRAKNDLYFNPDGPYDYEESCGIFFRGDL